MCVHMGKEAVRFLNRFGNINAENERITLVAFLRNMMSLFKLSGQWGFAETPRRLGLVILCARHVSQHWT